MQMPKVTDEHRRLLALAGSWAGDETLYPSPWDPKGGKATSTVTAHLALDGFFLISDYVEERGGQVSYRGHGVFGWDNSEKCYTLHWFDSMGGGGYTLPARGKWEGTLLTFEHRNPMGHARYMYQFEGEGKYTFIIEHSNDGTHWNRFMEGKFVRKQEQSRAF